MEGGKPENPEKNPQRRDENQQQTQPTCDAGSGNRIRATAMGGECSHCCAIPAPSFGNQCILNFKIMSVCEIKLRWHLSKIYTYLVIFSHFRGLSIRKSACVNVFGLVQIISRLDSQSKLQMFTLFYGCHIGGLRRFSNMAAPHYNFGWNILMNISTLEQCRHLKLGELSFLFIIYNIKISWLYPPKWFVVLFLIAWQWTHSVYSIPHCLYFWQYCLSTGSLPWLNVSCGDSYMCTAKCNPSKTTVDVKCKWNVTTFVPKCGSSLAWNLTILSVIVTTSLPQNVTTQNVTLLFFKCTLGNLKTLVLL